MKIITIISSRPCIIRQILVMQKLDKYLGKNHIVAYTGQNYDTNLYHIFLKDLGLRKPNYEFNLHQKLSGYEFIGQCMINIERLLKDFDAKHTLINVLGDVNGAFASIYVAKRMGFKVFHNESGNRSGRDILEEINRKNIDTMSHKLLCYSQRSRENLLAEGYNPNKIIVSGNPLGEVVKKYFNKESLIDKIPIRNDKYILVTLHRNETITNINRLKSITNALKILGEHYKIVLSLHPSLKDKMKNHIIQRMFTHENMELCEPFNYTTFLNLMRYSKVILSDCIDKHTLISTNNGLKEIKEVKSNDLVLQNNNKSETPIITKKFKKQAIKLIACGRIIITSKAHEIKTISGFKKMQNIKVGDYVQLNHKINYIGKNQKLNTTHTIPKYMVISKGGLNLLNKKVYFPIKISFSEKHLKNVLFGTRNISEFKLKDLCNELNIDFRKFIKKYCKRSTVSRRHQCNLINILTKELGEFIGQYIGDGRKPTDKNGLFIFDEELDSLIKLKKYLNLKFKLNTYIREKCRGNGSMLIINNKDFKNYIINNFDGLNYYQLQREVPLKILNSKKKIIASFLMGLFSADGGCDNLRIFFDNSSKKLVYQVQHLLLYFGIMSHINEHKGSRTKDKCIMYKLHITDRDSIIKYRKYIRFNIKRKNQLLNILIKYKKQKKKRTNYKIKNGQYYGRVTKKETLLNYNDYMYDFKFKSVNNYYANNILVHNSGGECEEACLLNVPCLVLRHETERTELLEQSQMLLCGTNTENILRAFKVVIDLPLMGIPEEYTKPTSSIIVKLLMGGL